MHIVGTESCLLLVFSLLCSCFTLLRVLYDKIWMLLHAKQLSLRVKAGFRMTLKWNWLIHSFIHHLCPSWTVCLPVSQFSNSHCLRLSVPFSVDHGLSTCLCLSFQAVTVSDSQCLSLSIMDCLPAWVSALKLSLSETLSAFLCLTLRRRLRFTMLCLSRHAIKMYKQQICETVKELNVFVLF